MSRSERCPAAEEVPSNLVEAAACGDTGALTRLLREGAKPDPTDPRPAYAGYTALHHAVARGDRQAIQLLLDAGAQADATDRQGNSPLHLLTLGDHIVGDDQIAEMLIRSGADVLRANRGGHTPLDELKARPRLSEATGNLSSYLSMTAKQLHLLARTRGYLTREEAPAGTFAALTLGGPDAGATFAVPPGDATGDPSAEQHIRETLNSWAQAWSRGDAGAHLAHYAAEFAPSEGRNRQDWMASRRDRIQSRQLTAVEIGNLDISVEGRTANARFTQTLRARDSREVSRKTMTLSFDSGHWQITSETEKAR